MAATPASRLLSLARWRAGKRSMPRYDLLRKPGDAPEAAGPAAGVGVCRTDANRLATVSVATKYWEEQFAEDGRPSWYNRRMRQTSQSSPRSSFSCEVV
jgi:hypothetical protein